MDSRPLRLLPAAFCACLLFLAACASPPRFVKRTPVLRLLYRPKTRPYWGSERFSFEIKRQWSGPESGAGGVEFSEPGGRAKIAIAFYPAGSELWRPEKEFKQYLRERGSVEDSHTLYELALSSRPAFSVRFTTHSYDPKTLLGERTEQRYCEWILVPEPDGAYLIRYETAKEDYFRFRKVFLDFLKSLSLAAPEAPAIEGEEKR